MTRSVGGHSPANLQKYLGDIDYPATKDDLLTQARRNDAPQEIIDAIERVPETRFGALQDAMKGYGESE